MQKYVIMGPQGSGKGTQAKRLEADLDLVHISIGDLLRWHIRSHTRLAARVEQLTSAGELVPDEIVQELTHLRLDQHDWSHGFILDGFPRNVAQSTFFLERYDVDALILLEMPDDAVFERVLARRSCGGCGLDYNLISQPPSRARPVRRLQRPTDRPGRRHAGGRACSPGRLSQRDGARGRAVPAQGRAGRDRGRHPPARAGATSHSQASGAAPRFRPGQARRDKAKARPGARQEIGLLLRDSYRHKLGARC